MSGGIRDRIGSRLELRWRLISGFVVRIEAMIRDRGELGLESVAWRQ